MHLHFKWSDATGSTKITSRSLETIQDRFGAESPIEVLDFLQDAIFMLTDEYNDALKAFGNRLKDIKHNA